MVSARTLKGIARNRQALELDLQRIRADHQAEADRKYAALGEENRRAMMAEFRQGGKENTIGEVARRYGVETMVMADLVCRNIEESTYCMLKPQSEVA